MFTEEEKPNPFLKSLKKPKPMAMNPLSLTDRSAGVSYEKENKLKLKNTEVPLDN